jgi:hypothetical protein
MTKIDNPPDAPKEETVTMTKSDLATLMARIDKVEKGDSSSVASIVAVTCNHCGSKVNAKGVCDLHPSEMVNHVAIGMDPETGLKRPRIARQTRAA